MKSFGPMTQTFGHRPSAKPVSKPMPTMAKFARPGIPAATGPAQPTGPSVEDEIREWKRTRGSHFPVRLLALVASVSFGAASFVLPPNVNSWVQYPLYALSAASLYVGFAHRRPKAGA
jgi:hypothetical protein